MEIIIDISTYINDTYYKEYKWNFLKIERKNNSVYYIFEDIKLIAITLILRS